MARTIQQIQQELDSVYAPQRQQVQQQIDAMPAYYAAQSAGLDQAKTNAFSDITAGANARGMVYSGMPIKEQATYVGTKYLPALAGLQQQQNTQKSNLLQTLNQIREKQMSQAQSLQQQELNREEQARQAEAARQQQERQFQRQMAARASAASASQVMPSPESSALKLLSAWASGDPANGVAPKMAWYTENAIIPQLAGAYGMSKNDAAKLVYGLRKQYFGE